MVVRAGGETCEFILDVLVISYWASLTSTSIGVTSEFVLSKTYWISCWYTSSRCFRVYTFDSVLGKTFWAAWTTLAHLFQWITLSPEERQAKFSSVCVFVCVRVCVSIHLFLPVSRTWWRYWVLSSATAAPCFGMACTLVQPVSQFGSSGTTAYLLERYSKTENGEGSVAPVVTSFDF